MWFETGDGPVTMVTMTLRNTSTAEEIKEVEILLSHLLYFFVLFISEFLSHTLTVIFAILLYYIHLFIFISPF